MVFIWKQARWTPHSSSHLPPPPPPPSPPPLFFPTQERKQVLGVDGVMFRNYVVRLQHNHLVFLLFTSELVVFQAPFTEPLRDVSHFSRRQKRRRDRRESPRLITGPTWLRFGLIIASHETPPCAPIGANLKQKL